MNNIVQLHRQTRPISHLIRVGYADHKILENLDAAGRIKIRQAVFDASHYSRHKDLISTLSASGAEIFLDTKTAELSNEAGYRSKAGTLPWANTDRTQWIGDWRGRRGRSSIKHIAEFVGDAGVDTVLSPTHFLSDAESPWLTTDIRSVELLRDALDSRELDHIRIDYHLTIPVSLFRDIDQLDFIIGRIVETPTGNIWLRVSGFGMKGTPAGLRRYIETTSRVAKFGKPIIADHVSGNIGLSLASFGGVGGICHGIAEKENFNISSWRSANRGGGTSKTRLFTAV